MQVPIENNKFLLETDCIEYTKQNKLSLTVTTKQPALIKSTTTYANSFSPLPLLLTRPVATRRAPLRGPDVRVHDEAAEQGR